VRVDCLGYRYLGESHPEINDFALAEEVTPRYGTTDTLEQFLVQWKDAGPHRHVHPDGAGRITGK
jgi:hypothetical protein